MNRPRAELRPFRRLWWRLEERAQVHEPQDPVALFGAERVAVMVSRLESGRVMSEEAAVQLLGLEDKP